ncbi:putative ubiquitin-conjugating enzyme E2 39 [Lotus japonicus]|uniref:putative ubiquitin-conjugating enzyme E2 39 n=1 Tax=Lotus japonicus TaxID=34305 RepID=UPI002586C2A9|nr:putative ubiquitin-conjugating enzyme E2 39 [Lotus japonicus]
MEDMKTRNKFEFKNFDVVLDDSDHHFVNQEFSNINSRAYKSIMKEWKILEQNLPESIYVRVYEGRIDLMRAVIIGANGTPFRDGLFFFDIAFPSNYPDSPPKIHFISFGLTQLSPHLLHNGEVCLSLVRWLPLAKKFQKWNPSVSTCFQLLLSIQALVLKEKRIFNQPAIALDSNWYIVQAYRETCKLVVHLIQRPPKNFETFVKGYFCDRATVILAAFIEYAYGRVCIGYYGSASSSSSLPRKNSFMSKRWAQEFYPIMVNAFELCGASLDPSLRSLVLLSESEKKKSTILKKGLSHIKSFITGK